MRVSGETGSFGVFLVAVTFLVLIVPSGIFEFDYPFLGFGTAQVFFSIAVIAVIFGQLLTRRLGLWNEGTSAEKTIWSGAILLFALIVIQFAIRPSEVGLGFAAGLVIFLFGIPLSQLSSFGRDEKAQKLIVAAIFFVLATNIPWLILSDYGVGARSDYGVDVRLTYALAVFSPVLLQVAWRQRAMFFPAYILTWALYVFSAWQQLRASTLIFAVVLIVWTLGISLSWKRNAISALVSIIALVGIWRQFVTKPLVVDGELYVSARGELLAVANQQESIGRERILNALFGHGPGYARRQLLESGYSHGDLHSTVQTLAIDYGLVILLLFGLFFIGVLLKMSGLAFSAQNGSSLDRWAPVLMTGGAYASLALVYDVVVVFETLSTFLVAVSILAQPTPWKPQVRVPRNH